jgi:DNA-binding transcriptional LysR family regulator
MVTEHIIINSGQDFIAIQNIEQGVQSSEHSAMFENLDTVHWDDWHLLKTVAAVESFRQAAIKLGSSVNTVRARVERLEGALGTILFKRSHSGIKLSPEGSAALEIAIEMQSFSSRMQRGRGNNVVVQEGEFRIACSEGLGTYWLTPRLHDLRERIPDHIIAMHNEFDQHRIHSRAHDICIGFAKPTNPDVIVKKLATVHQMLFASEGYLAKHGMPTSINETRRHRFVLQSAPGVKSDAIGLFLGEDGANQLVAARFNTGNSLLAAISNGIGIGALPTYAGAISKNLVPLDVPVWLKFDLWLSFDRSGIGSRPVREAINWLKGCFDPDSYPWFADDFVHPKNFADQLDAELTSHHHIV